MTELQTNIVQDLLYIETDLGSPKFNFQGVNYPFIPSITSFTRELESGGYYVAKLLSATVRILNCDGSNQFPGALPTAQQTITYSVDSQAYRIESIKIDPTNSHFRLVAVSKNRGI